MELEILEERYVTVYKELLIEMDRLFLLQNGCTMSQDMKSKSELRALHQLNVSKTATLLNLDPETSSKKYIDTKLLASFDRDGELNEFVSKQWNLIQEYVQLIQESSELRQKLIEVSRHFPKRQEEPNSTRLEYEILDSIYSVLLVQGGYQDQVSE